MKFELGKEYRGRIGKLEFTFVFVSQNEDGDWIVKYRYDNETIWSKLLSDGSSFQHYYEKYLAENSPLAKALS